MKIKTLIIVAVILLSACKNNKEVEKQNGETKQKVEVIKEKNNIETFKTIDMAIVDRLNLTISSKNLKTEEEIMNAYKPKSIETEGHYSYAISKKDIGNDSKEITLIEDGLLDDSLAAVKTIMIVKKENSELKVVSLKENYKCKKNRGHQSWSAELCN